jgi:DNA-binding MarR family transcriptional regulator/GNAT superfamily N-acetyltransferase
MNASAALDHRVAAVRRFNRFYTQKIGVLQEALLRSPFSLTEARVLYELAHRDGATATWLARELELDPGYLSRILRGFQRQGLVERVPSPQDGRQSLVSLTTAGRHAFAPLDAGSQAEIGAMLQRLAEPEQNRLITAMRTVAGLLGDEPEPRMPYLLRPHRVGDMGWVASRHGVLYAEEYGFDERFEALVAEIAAKFIHDFDPAREQCWIAERDGENVGSVFLVRKTDETAVLRLFLVEPKARGLGIGRRLAEECVRFARQKGYCEITLWTQSILVAARRIYAAAGFRLVAEEEHHSFGRDLVGETWVMTL